MKNEELFFDVLKSHRESKEIEISEICEFTKINSKYIEAIESGEFAVLPTVYMRLFLRAYADFIGADSEKALEDFELHTTGKVQKRTDFKIKSTENSGKSDEVKISIESTSHIPPKQIATGVAVIIGLFLVLYWAGKITSEQKSSVKMSPEPVKATEPLEAAPPDLESIPTEKPEEGSAEKKSSVIDPSVVSGVEKSEKTLPPSVKKVAETIPEPEEVKPEILPNKLPLNTNDFLLENRERETTNILKLFEPYIITILTLEETKLNISRSHEDKLTELINKVTPAGEIFQFDFESIINFEFWNNTHIRVKLNEMPLDNFLSDDGLSIRGSYEVDKSQLYLGFYRN